jgi:hypothetical protein
VPQDGEALFCVFPYCLCNACAWLPSPPSSSVWDKSAPRYGFARRFCLYRLRQRSLALLTLLSAIPRRVDDAIKKLRYIDYSLLSRSSREQATRDDEGLVVTNGRVELKSKAMTPGEDGEMSQIEWLAAAGTVVERTLEHHGAARSDLLKLHHRNVLEVARSYEWETARIYDMKTRGLMASDPRHDPSTSRFNPTSNKVLRDSST